MSNSQKFFSGVIDRFLSMAKNQTEIIQHGRHRYYKCLYCSQQRFWVGASCSTMGLALFLSVLEIPYMFAIVLLIIAATMSAVISNSRLVALVSLGVIGFLLSLIFMLYGAVDVAITLIITETLIVILFMVIIYHLPPYRMFRAKVEYGCNDRVDLWKLHDYDCTESRIVQAQGAHQQFFLRLCRSPTDRISSQCHSGRVQWALDSC